MTAAYAATGPSIDPSVDPGNPVEARLANEEAAIRSLGKISPRVRQLFARYGEASRRLRRLEVVRSPYTRVESEMLRRRCGALADQILTLVDRRRGAS